MNKYTHWIAAIIMLLGALGHMVVPEIYAPMIPDFVSESFANYLSVIVEAGIGILLILPKTRSYGGLVFGSLMIAFLPLHLWDLLRDDPVIRPYAVAVFRVIIQFLLIYMGWRIFKMKK